MPSLPENSPPAPETSGCVLIVDDLAPNVRLLSGILRVEGFDILSANSGPEALVILDNQTAEGATGGAPDVVLLDVMMPGMDGFEVCRLIRSNPATAYISVVMVTALQDTADRVRAIEAGANDFLTKPVEVHEVVARVRSLVSAKRDRDALEKAYGDLKKAEEMRDFLSEMLVHDLRTPLTAVLASLDLLQSGSVGTLDALQKEIVDMSMKGSQKLLALVNELLDISKLESGEMKLQREPLDVKSVVAGVLEQVAGQALYQQTSIDTDIAPDFPPLTADEDLLTRMLVNLLGNSLKFSRNGAHVQLAVRLENEGQTAIFAVSDNGEGIAPEDQERIFTKFGQAQSRQSRRRTSTGLGLTFCRLVAEAHQGRIWVESVVEKGSTFFVALPLQ